MGVCGCLCDSAASVLWVVVLISVFTSVEVSARIRVMSTLDDETVYIVKDKPLIMNIDSPSRGMLILAKPVNACGPIQPPPANSSVALSSPSPPPSHNLSLSESGSEKTDNDFAWILLVSWSASEEDCSVRTKTERAAEAGYTVVLFQDPAEMPDNIQGMDEPLLGPFTSNFEFAWTDASVYACTINPQDWEALRKNFTSDEYYLSFEDPNSMSGWFTYFIVGILVLGAVFFTIGLSYVIVQLLVLILLWIRESIVSRIMQMRRDRRRRLPASQLKKIPIQQWNSDMLQDICSICLDSFEVLDRVRILPCSHVFHQPCIDPWLLKQRRKCPNCKRKIVFPDENRESDSSSDDERTPLLMGSSFRDSSSSSRSSPVAASRPAQVSQQRHSTEEQVGHVNPAVESDSTVFRPQAHQSPSPINTSIEVHGTSGSPSSTSSPQEIRGKVDQLCARVESVGRKIRKKVKANQAYKQEINDSSSDLSTTVQPLLVSVTVEPHPSHHHHDSYHTDITETPPVSEQELVQGGEESRIHENDKNGELEVKVVPDCSTSGSPSHVTGSSNNSNSNNT